MYHYGEIHNEKKIVYRLAGNKKFHIMRIEIGFNSNLLSYSIKRKNSENNYMNNDTDLSFIKESSYNGRGLLNIYTKNGEDIYLTIFNNNINNKLTNYAFKYINAEKNGDFKNYFIINDDLSFTERDLSISIKKIDNIPDSCIVDCFAKIIDKENYIKNEKIKTIAITQSIGNSYIKGINQNENDLVIFYLNYGIDRTNFYSNAYCKIIGENFELDYLSYNGLIIVGSNEFEPTSEDNSTLYIIIISVSGFIFLIIIILVVYFIILQKRNRALLNEMITKITFDDDNLLSEDDDDNILK